MLKKEPVIVIVDNSISYTGAFKCALQQALLLRPHYRYVFVLPDTTDLVDTVKINGFAVYTLPLLEIKKDIGALFGYLPTLVRNAGKLKQIVQKEKADVLCMNDFYNLLGVAVKLSGFKIKLITYVRFLPAVMPAPLRKLWIGLAKKYADKIVAVSDAVVRQLPSIQKVTRIYDAVNFPEKLPPGKGPVLENFVQLLYLGNYIQGKGHDHALAAFRIAYRENNRLRLTFVGGDMGLDKNRQFKNELQRVALSSGLGEVVRFLPFEKDVEAVLKKADIFLNFPEAESFSMTCAEACYYGLPVIATRCGGPEEIIADGETGLLVENKNVAQMAAAILKLAGSAERQRQFSAKAPAYVKEKFSVHNFVMAYRRLLSDLLVSV